MKHFLYNTWKKMRDRCNNPNAHNYSKYGGRGITVCSRWDSFDKFVEDMGERPSPMHTLDRINPNGNYEPSNCRWATKTEQNRNRRNVYKINDMTIPQLAEKLGCHRTTIRKQLANGKTIIEICQLKSDIFLTDSAEPIQHKGVRDLFWAPLQRV